MNGFRLKIVTPDGLIFDDTAEKILVRTLEGDMAVLAGHINCVCPLGTGRAVIEAGGRRRTAACSGGMLNVINGAVTLVSTTFAWAEDTDAARK
jgi:F-type H+-transporting ATPase subunit epsilon